MIGTGAARLADATNIAPVIQPLAEATGVFSYLWLLIALPLLGATVLLLGGRRTQQVGNLEPVQLEQPALRHEAVQRGQRTHLGGRDPAHDVLRPQLRGMGEAGGRQQLLQRHQGIAVEVGHPHRLAVRVQRRLPVRVLGGDAGRAAVGVAALRLDAAQREHEAARRIAPVRAHRHRAGDVERAGDAPGDQL